MARIPDLCMAVARSVRDGRHDEAERLRLELRKEKLAAKIREAVAAAPRMTPEQIAELRSLLVLPESSREVA